MSIKLELDHLRKRQSELKKSLSDFRYKLAMEESQQKSTTRAIEQLSQRKSELAVKLWQEQRQKLEIQTQKINELRENIERCRSEYSSNAETIESYLNDTSFYTNEQVSFLVQALLNYIIEHESEIGINISNKFSIAEFKYSYHCNGSPSGSFVKVPTGDFVIRFNEAAILQTKDYYFERDIVIKRYNAVSGLETITIADWYFPYAENFKKVFMNTFAKKYDAFAKKYQYKNFTLTCTGDSFTLDLI